MLFRSLKFSGEIDRESAISFLTLLLLKGRDKLKVRDREEMLPWPRRIHLNPFFPNHIHFATSLASVSCFCECES